MATYLPTTLDMGMGSFENRINESVVAFTQISKRVRI